MYFQIEKIVLWPKKIQCTYKTVDFCCNKVNVITGASRTGKSAIIPIIDYCLGDHKCQIPVNTIRDACSWFGIIVKMKDKRILLARREPEQKQATDDMMIIEGKEIVIPGIPVKNTTRKNVLRYLDETARVSFIKVEQDEMNGFTERPSFRDMMAFCYQSQNIIANANTLFYKTDAMEHRTKLINIFPYILGAVTPSILAKRQELNDLEKELRRKEREMQKMQEVADKWRIEIGGWINAAKEFGLVTVEYSTETLSFEQQMLLLKQISQKSSSDTVVLKENIENASKEIVALRQQENKLSLELSKYKSRYLEMTQFVESIDEYRKTLSIQVERLSVSRWLKELTEKNGICPFCGSKHEVTEQMNNLVNSLKLLENESEEIAEVPVAFEREYSIVQGKISELTEKINAIQKRIKIQNDKKDETYNQKYTMENVSRFLGKVQYAEETYRAIGYDGELQGQITELKSKISVLKAQINEANVQKKFKAALKNIELKIMKLLPLLDIERPEDIVKVDYKNLTISVMGKTGREDYLWEIGSGSNWLAYHISVSLAFQMFFAEQNFSPVPQFIVYDQPSQVYFPKKLSRKEEEKEEDPKLDDEDVFAVRKIFATMSDALKKTNPQMQIIVLEHASESAWEGVKNMNLVEEWRGEDNKLIPKDWIE
ncbi:hypothetical protein IMSAGC018_00590 [Lachnospiraceae bacterium]|nr:hypothetical protein IMSAGC018_00590 [Lachnospiraceae bacterium]